MGNVWEKGALLLQMAPLDVAAGTSVDQNGKSKNETKLKIPFNHAFVVDSIPRFYSLKL